MTTLATQRIFHRARTRVRAGVRDLGAILLMLTVMVGVWLLARFLMGPVIRG